MEKSFSFRKTTKKPFFSFFNELQLKRFFVQFSDCGRRMWPPLFTSQNCILFWIFYDCVSSYFAMAPAHCSGEQKHFYLRIVKSKLAEVCGLR